MEQETTKEKAIWSEVQDGLQTEKEKNESAIAWSYIIFGLIIFFITALIMVGVYLN